jgi:hypothetical protein
MFNSGGAHFDVTVKVMLLVTANLRRLGFAALLLSGFAGTAYSQETPAPAPVPAPSQTPPAATPSAEQAAPQTAPAATPATPEYADMLYASDQGMLDTFSSSCSGDCDSCGQMECMSCCPPRFWASVEGLAWWQKGQFTQPLVTTSPPGTSQALAGVLGADTTVLVGDGILPYDGAFGGRFTVGHWLDDSEEHALLGRFWILGDTTYDNTQVSDGTNILAIPFVNVDIAAEDARLVGFPNGQQGTLSGNINVHTVSQFYGGDVLLRTPIYRDCVRRWDLVAGYMFSKQDESLEMSSLTFIDPGTGIDTSVSMLDRFTTSNEFHGGVLGLSIKRQVACYTVDLLAKVAFGNMLQRNTIDGSTTTASGTGVQVDNFGLFAQSTNIGVLENNQFCVVPEVNLNIGYYICPCLKLYGGYTFIYWSSVARPGDQMDRLINTTFQGPLPVGDPRPEHSRILSHNTWVHGVNVGLEYRF